MPSSKHKAFIKMAKGFRGRGKNVYSIARNRVEKGLTVRLRNIAARFPLPLPTPPLRPACRNRT